MYSYMMSHIDCNEKLGLIAGKKDNIFDPIKVRGHGGHVKLKFKNSEMPTKILPIFHDF